jgi:hypothetical protein
MKEQGKAQTDALFGPKAGMVDADGIIFDFQDMDEGLLLAEYSGGKNVELFLGELPGPFGA